MLKFVLLLFIMVIVLFILIEELSLFIWRKYLTDQDDGETRTAEGFWLKLKQHLKKDRRNPSNG